MDCVDCHNRPSHQYRQPGTEIDVAIRDGAIDRSLPFVKRESLRIIDAKYPSVEEARQAFDKELKAFYEVHYPDLADSKAQTIEKAAAALGDIYSLNVFPKMNVWWNTYPDHIGHEQSAGCFRCHGRKLRTADGKRISRK